MTEPFVSDPAADPLLLGDLHMAGPLGRTALLLVAMAAGVCGAVLAAWGRDAVRWRVVARGRRLERAQWLAWRAAAARRDGPGSDQRNLPVLAAIDAPREALRSAAKDARWQGVFTASDEELVSSDIVGEPYASIADLGMTRVVDGTLVKVLAWYDNEMGYTETLVKHAILAGRS